MFKWVWSYVRKYRFWMFFGLSLSVIVAALNMINPLVTGQIVDKVIRNGEHNRLVKLILIMVLCTVTKSVFRYLYQLMFEHSSQNVIRAMRQDLYAHIQTLDFPWYDKSPSGNVMTLLTSDLDAVRHFVAWVMYQIVENVLIYVFSILVLSSINWKLTLAFLVIAPFIIFLVQKFKVQIKPAHMKVRDQFAVLNTRVGENISGNRVVKAFVRENFEIERFDKENEAYKNKAVENADIRIKYTPVIEALCGLLPVILILFGGYLVIKCDASGHGVPAAIVMTIVATLFRQYYTKWTFKRNGTNVNHLISQINILVESLGLRGKFAAMIVCLYNVDTGELYMSNAGDNIVHIYDSQTKKMKQLTLDNMPAAGVFATDMIAMRGGYKIEKT